MGYIQDLRNLCDRHILAFESKRGSARYDPQVVGLRQQVQQLLRHPIGEVLLLRVRTHINERQYRD